MSKWQYKDRYGIPGAEVGNLVKRYYAFRYAEGWGTADAFLLWCSENGYQKGWELRKKDETQNHGPENSYFFSLREARRERALRTNHKREQRKLMQMASFCRNCPRDQRNDCPRRGCAAWQENFRQNWDKNIHVPKPNKPEKTKPEVFCYEHPDLVREGIVFHAEC